MESVPILSCCVHFLSLLPSELREHDVVCKTQGINVTSITSPSNPISESVLIGRRAGLQKTQCMKADNICESSNFLFGSNVNIIIAPCRYFYGSINRLSSTSKYEDFEWGSTSQKGASGYLLQNHHHVSSHCSPATAQHHWCKEHSEREHSDATPLQRNFKTDQDTHERAGSWCTGSSISLCRL